MDQPIVAQKILAELLQLKVVNDVDEDIVFAYLCQAFAAGYDEGKLQKAHRRPVMKMNMNGDPICIYQSALVAARKTGLTKSAISKAALGKIAYSGGFKWKYVDEIQNGSQNDGAGPG